MIDSEENIFRIFCSIVLLGRSFGIILGYFSIGTIKKRVYPRAPKEVTPLFGRMWSNWTLVSLVLLLTMILYPRNPQVYALNLFAFGLALLHFVLEQYVFKTGSFVNLCTILCFAGVTGLYMVLRYFLKEDIFHQNLPNKLF